MQETYLKTKDFLVSGKEFELRWNEEFRCLQTFPVPKDLAAYYQLHDHQPTYENNRRGGVHYTSTTRALIIFPIQTGPRRFLKKCTSGLKSST